MRRQKNKKREEESEKGISCEMKTLGHRSRCGGSLGKNNIFLPVKLSQEWKELARETKVNLLINPD